MDDRRLVSYRELAMRTAHPHHILFAHAWTAKRRLTCFFGAPQRRVHLFPCQAHAGRRNRVIRKESQARVSTDLNND